MNLQHSILSLWVFFFFFFHRWNPAQRPCRGWKNQGYFPVDWFLSMRNRVIRLGTFGSCVSFLSFMHAYIVPAWNFQVSFPPPFFFVVGDVGTPGEDTKRNLEETYSKRRSFVKTFLFLFSPPPPSSSPFHFIRAYVFWIFGSLKSKLKFSSELRLKFRMFRYDSKLVEDLNDWWYFNRLTMTSLILLVTTVFHVWSFYLLLYLFDYTS